MNMPSSRLPPLQALITLQAVLRYQSVSRAADELCVTHSAVSQTIKQLEQMLGQKLFDKVGRNIQPRPLTLQYMQDITPHLQRIAEITHDFQRLSQPLSLNIKMVSTLALRWFVPRIADLKQRLPNLHVRLITEPVSDVSNMPADVDVALGFASAAELKGFYAKLLAPSQLVLVLSRGAVSLFEQEQEHEKDQEKERIQTLLNKHNSIYVQTPLRANDWQHWCAVHKVSEPKTAQRIVLDNSAQALEALTAGAGALVTQQLFVESLLELQQVVTVGQAVTDNSKGYYFYCKPDALKRPEVQSFEQWLLEQS